MTNRVDDTERGQTNMTFSYADVMLTIIAICLLIALFQGFPAW